MPAAPPSVLEDEDNLVGTYSFVNLYHLPHRPSNRLVHHLDNAIVYGDVHHSTQYLETTVDARSKKYLLVGKVKMSGLPAENQQVAGATIGTFLGKPAAAR
jgi:hypothetical protein